MRWNGGTVCTACTRDYLDTDLRLSEGLQTMRKMVSDIDYHHHAPCKLPLPNNELMLHTDKTRLGVDRRTDYHGCIRSWLLDKERVTKTEREEEHGTKVTLTPEDDQYLTLSYSYDI